MENVNDEAALIDPVHDAMRPATGIWPQVETSP
jgi:hypothetical protein